MHIDEKRSNVFVSDLKSGGLAIPKQIKGSLYRELATFSGSYAEKDVSVKESLKSINEIVLIIRPDDRSKKNSAYKHGHPTTFTGDELVAALNLGTDMSELCYLKNFNITLPNNNDLMFQPQGISDLERFQKLTKASKNMFNNKVVATCPLS